MSSSPQSDPSPRALAPPPVRPGRGFRFWPSSLTGRLVLTTITLVAVVSIVVATVTTFALHSFLLQRLDDQLDSAGGRYFQVICSGDPGSYPGGCRSGPQDPQAQAPVQSPGTLN